MSNKSYEERLEMALYLNESEKVKLIQDYLEQGNDIPTLAKSANLTQPSIRRFLKRQTSLTAKNWDRIVDVMNK